MSNENDDVDVHLVLRPSPVRGMSEKQKRKARDTSQLLQGAILEAFRTIGVSRLEGGAATLNIATIAFLEAGLSRAHYLEMVGRVYDEIAAKARRG